MEKENVEVFYLYWAYNQAVGTHNFISERTYAIGERVYDEENDMWFEIIDYAIEAKRVIDETPVYFW